MSNKTIAEETQLEKPTIVEVFSDNGEHSHWTLIDTNNGEKLWSENPIECKSMGYPTKKQSEIDELTNEVETLKYEKESLKESLHNYREEVERLRKENKKLHDDNFLRNISGEIIDTVSSDVKTLPPLNQ